MATATRGANELGIAASATPNGNTTRATLRCGNIRGKAGIAY
jgi:hypothetical protein